MAKLNMLLFQSVNSLFKHQKVTKKGSISLHLTHQMTHGLTHDLGLKSIIVSPLAAVMAVMTNLSPALHKNYSFRFLPLSTSLIKAPQKSVYKMAEPIGMAYSLNIKPITF